MKNSENNFKELRQLLKLKQHEIPPPGYFNHFSDQVISRLQSGEGHGAQSLTDRLNVQAPWLASLLRVFETQPGVIGGFATSLVVLLVIGVIISERPDSMPNNILTATANSQPAPSLASVTNPDLGGAAQASGIVASTNPVTSLQPVATLFGQPGGSSTLFQAASFSPAGN
jgi:hypothetical protein